MKFRRFLSGLLFGIGCAMIFIGILAAILPHVSNQQLQLVLGSFSLSSDNALVQLINRAMSFAFLQSWRVLLFGILAAAAGAWLLLYFTPKKPKPSPIKNEAPIPSPPPTEPLPEVQTAEKAPNPFAVGTYLDHLPIRDEKNSASFIRYQTPILEPNRIGKPLTASVSSDDRNFQSSVSESTAEPFFSNRFETESKAIESERSIPSQSGSSMLIRTVFDETIAGSTAEQPKISAKASEDAVPVRSTVPLSASSDIPPFSPRIRSTMGRRSIR